MARPSNQAKIDRAAQLAEEKIKARVDELVDVLLAAALEAPQELQCPHCRAKFKGKNVGDPAIAMKLLERVAGKATDKPSETPKTKLEDLVTRLAEAGTKSRDKEAAEEKERRAAEVRKALAGARATPGR